MRFARTCIPVFLFGTAMFGQAASGDAVMLLQILREPSILGTSFYQGTAQKAGDGIAVAIARTQPRTTLLDPVKASILIDVLRAAFGNPGLIADRENKNPGVSLLLLGTIARETPDPAVQQKARDLMAKLEALPH